MASNTSRFRFWIVLLLLVAAHFALRPMLGDPRFAPDFLLIALVFLAIRSRPGVGAAAGFVVGILTDAVAPTAFGAAALAHTLIGFGAGWMRAVFVTDNLLINALVVFSAAWLRDIIQVVASNQLAGSALLWQLAIRSPLAALSTALAALLVRVFLRSWLDTRAS